MSYLIPGKIDKTGEYSINRATNDRTFKRLTETSQMILDAMGGNIGLAQREGKFIERGSHDLVPGGEGWRSVVRVRLLHGTARRRIMERVRHGESTEKQGIPNYNFSVDGYPINQEDMAATLASFCTVSPSHLFGCPECLHQHRPHYGVCPDKDTTHQLLKKATLLHCGGILVTTWVSSPRSYPAISPVWKSATSFLLQLSRTYSKRLKLIPRLLYSLRQQCPSYVLYQIDLPFRQH